MVILPLFAPLQLASVTGVPLITTAVGSVILAVAVVVQPLASCTTIL